MAPRRVTECGRIDAHGDATPSSVAAMAAQAWFSRSDIEVVPGTSAVFQLTIVNLGDTTESFSLAPVGLAAGWTTIRPGSVTLFGGSQEVVDVEVHPPLLPSTTAGPTALTVRIVPQSDPDDVGSSETTLQVGPTYTRRLHMLQPALRARRSAVYEMMLENQGNTQASCRLHLLDPTGRVDGDFDPPAAGVEPGASSLIRLKVHATRLQWERRSRTVQFTIDADQPGCPNGQRAGHVRAGVDDPRAAVRSAACDRCHPRRARRGVVRHRQAGRPRCRRRRRRRTASCGDRLDIGGQIRRSSPDDSVPVTTVVVPPRATRSTKARCSAQLLAPADTRRVDRRPPRSTCRPGSTFQLTDFALQNPDKDLGVAVLLNGANEIYRVSLNDVQLGDKRVSWVSPPEVLGGTSLVFQVTCTGPGGTASGNCTTTMLVSGRMVATPPLNPAG